ncbi:GNAT family N-acetyltransferase [Vibrio sp. S4M6]|uniref:GNAT family N-acetyltransferase n=1 Tax=Vibrio sinus TaxID=2946865 RepID=UPI00202AB781|nr:GNAT family N-acetyltransferase [Vibrio sinus]MCL9780213.1 GNAT family N-acetyltransferase [Vibrio sinus]
MKVKNLMDEPTHLNQLAVWHHQEWTHLNPGQTLEERKEKMRLYLGPELLPSTFIGKVDEELVGSAAIVECDMDSHPELSPWLASVFVADSFRQQGYGGRLVKHIMSEAKAAGIEKLYLFTPSQAKFYASLGWKVHSEERYRGENVTVMEVSLHK